MPRAGVHIRLRVLALPRGPIPPHNGGMCARFTLRRRLNLVMKELAESLPVGLSDWYPGPEFNIAAARTVAAGRPTADTGKNERVPLKWL